MKLSVYTEYDVLKKVLVHRPGREIEKLVPENLKYLLFEDTPFLEAMQREHKSFINVLISNGIEVLYLEKLLLDLLQDNELRNQLVMATTYLERCESLNVEFLEKLTVVELEELLIEGLTAKEAIKKGFSFIQGSALLNDFFIIPPLPNMYFMRDPGAVVGNGFLSSNMHHNARIRESLLVEYIFKYHKMFKNKIHFLFGVEDDERRPFTIEGGDVLIINRDAIAIGCSERTRSESIRKFARKVFRKKMFSRVYEVYIPFQREYMHLDTVFSIIDKDTIVAYPDALKSSPETGIYRPDFVYDQIEARLDIERRPFLDVLEEELGKFQIVKTGGTFPQYASKEQRSDGTNVFAIAPKKVITYDRNKHTNKALKDAGIEVIEIIGSELVRGLGGPRCMTMPLEREGNYE